MVRHKPMQPQVMSFGKQERMKEESLYSDKTEPNLPNTPKSLHLNIQSKPRNESPKLKITLWYPRRGKRDS